MNESTHILGIHGCPRLYEHLDHVVVFPPSCEVECGVVQGLLNVLDLDLIGEQFLSITTKRIGFVKSNYLCLL